MLNEAQDVVVGLGRNLANLANDLGMAFLVVLLLGLATLLILEALKDFLQLRLLFQRFAFWTWANAKHGNLRHCAKTFEALGKRLQTDPVPTDKAVVAAEDEEALSVQWANTLLRGVVKDRKELLDTVAKDLFRLTKQIGQHHPAQGGTRSSLPKALLGREVSLALPLDQLSAQLANIAQTAQDRPSDRLESFLVFSDGVDRRDQLAVLMADLLRRHDPELLEEATRIEGKPSKAVATFASVLGEAQEAISFEVDKNIDGWQLGLNQRLLRWRRLSAFVVSVAIAFLLIVMEQGSSEAVAPTPWTVFLISLILGAIASYIVTLLYGLLGALRSSRFGR